MEIELNLVDEDYQPMMNNAQVLEHIADPRYQTELGQYNIEFNVEPRLLPGDSARTLETDLRQSLNRAETLANKTGSHIVQIGILPTVMPEHFRKDWMSANVRYAALNEAMVNARGEDMFIDIQGVSGERLATYADSIGPESAGTSVQLHLQVTPQEFAPHWNAAQALAGLQLSAGANSPFFFGKQLWHETRTELFRQATDTRPVELKNQASDLGSSSGTAGSPRSSTCSKRTCATSRRSFPRSVTRTRRRLSRPAGRSAVRAQTAQRDDLPVEPPDLRRGRRHTASADREPGPACRSDDHRHHGQLRVLLRRHAHPC